MLRIRQKQLDAFDEALEESFRRRLVRSIERVYPDEIYDLPRGNDGSPNVHGVVESALQHASSLGLDDDDDITAYVAILIESPRLAREAPALLATIREMLIASDISGQAKIELLLRDLRELGSDEPRAAALCAHIETLRGALT